MCECVCALPDSIVKYRSIQMVLGSIPSGRPDFSPCPFTAKVLREQCCKKHGASSVQASNAFHCCLACVSRMQAIDKQLQWRSLYSSMGFCCSDLRCFPLLSGICFPNASCRKAVAWRSLCRSWVQSPLGASASIFLTYSAKQKKASKDFFLS